jgi:predicted RNA-binding protein YlxR (DUF448 family)
VISLDYPQPNTSNFLETETSITQVSKKGKKKRKHVPQRTCIGCRKVQPKRSLIRVVRTEEGIQVDLSGKLPGRGAYLHELRTCWEAGLKNSLARALKTDLTPDDLDRLTTFMASLPEESPSGEGTI